MPKTESETPDVDIFLVCREISDMASLELGITPLSDEHISLVIRFSGACCKCEDIPLFDDWLRATMFSRLSIESKREIVTLVESEVETKDKETSDAEQ